jgi:hypothetical protein
MLAKIAVAARVARDDGSRPRRQADLPERGKSAKVHDGSGFICRIPAVAGPCSETHRGPFIPAI